MRTFRSFERLLNIKRYSKNSINTYLGLLQVFQEFLGDTRIEDLDRRSLLNAILRIVEHKKYGYASQKQLISVLKLYFKEIQNREIDFSSVYPTRKPSALPEILSLKEVKSMLDHTTNMKHKTMLSMVYALGLRSGELITLKVKDIDSERKTVHLKGAKGNKDRLLPLSEKLHVLLRSYYKKYKPTVYLFAGRDNDKYTSASLRKVFKNSVIKAQIKKTVTLHSLRHSYATHLLEKGTDIRIIQKLLGHNSIQTTMIYTHVAQRSMLDVQSPFDSL